MNAERNTSFEVAKLTYVQARRICERHGHREVAMAFANELLDKTGVGTLGKKELADEQISLFATGLVDCVDRASQISATFDELPTRTKQGDALRDLEFALEKLRLVISRNWPLIKPLVETEVAENLASLLANDAVMQLLPTKRRSAFMEQLAKPSKLGHQNLLLSYLLLAQQQVLMRMMKRAKITLRRARNRVASGAPLKAPFEIVLIMQFADHYEWALQKKATTTEGGPFSRFCWDVFETLRIESAYEWEHLLKVGLKLHRTSLAVRQRHMQSSATHTDCNKSGKRKSRKHVLTSLRKSKINEKQ